MELFLNNFLFAGSVIILISVLLSNFSDRFGLPILVLFMFIGMIAGSEGLVGIHFENFELTHVLSVIALCLIIFSGGVETDYNKVKKHIARGALLSSLGIVLTTVSIGAFVHYVFEMSIVYSLLLGATLSATDAAAVFSAFKDKNSQICGSTKNLLKFESGSNDPMAYLLVIILLGFVGGGQTSFTDVGIQLVVNPVMGLVIGWILSRLFIYLSNVINLTHVGLYPALTLSFLFLAYSFANKVGGNGFLSVYVLGISIGQKKIPHRTLLTGFYDGISWLSQIGLFVMLGLLVYPSHLVPVASQGFYIAIFSIIIARPLTVFICTIGSEFSFKERIFISWAGLKGATPIVFACLIAVKLGDGQKADLLFNIVFFVVLFSALVQGSTLKFLARKLGLLFESYEDPNFPIDVEMLEKTKNGIKEIYIRESDYAVDKRIVDLYLPTGCLILFIKREGSFIVPDGSTKFKVSDRVLMVTMSKSDISEAKKCFFQGIIQENTYSVDVKDEQVH